MTIPVDIISEANLSQMKINPRSTPQVNKPKVGLAANLNYLDDDDRKIPGLDPHPFKIKNTPGINKNHQVNKITPDDNLERRLMKKPGKHLLAEKEKFSATGGNLKTSKINPGYKRFLQVDIGESKRNLRPGRRKRPG